MTVPARAPTAHIRYPETERLVVIILYISAAVMIVIQTIFPTIKSSLNLQCHWALEFFTMFMYLCLVASVAWGHLMSMYLMLVVTGSHRILDSVMSNRFQYLYSATVYMITFSAFLYQIWSVQMYIFGVSAFLVTMTVNYYLFELVKIYKRTKNFGHTNV